MSKKKHKNKFKDESNLRDMRKDENVIEEENMSVRKPDTNVIGMQAPSDDMDGPHLGNRTESSNRTQDEGKVYDL